MSVSDLEPMGTTRRGLHGEVAVVGGAEDDRLCWGQSAQSAPQCFFWASLGKPRCRLGESLGASDGQQENRNGEGSPGPAEVLHAVSEQSDPCNDRQEPEGQERSRRVMGGRPAAQLSDSQARKQQCWEEQERHEG